MRENAAEDCAECTTSQYNKKQNSTNQKEKVKKKKVSRNKIMIREPS